MHSASVGEFNEDMCAVTLEKTEGDMHRKVVVQGANTAPTGMHDGGMNARLSLRTWFMGPTGLHVPERRALLMRPAQSKHEESIADAVESWGERERTCN